ncbi:nucleoporin complex subunit 54 [Toxoplasma gondii RUB]|uniref:Nucleoporin Nup54 alpha-helical domain-containing protein n=7 Tax=Toxoplasma gondii TaxID=5811 RepID=S7V107_TOXGG|nr:hypothetical protein TGGT1_248500 [Toxoplasma gondii GT1]KAF4638630.1 hypothetical protein TGRH88_062380 [Toxoplasma gondii]KFG46577.1 nucleoporin complex subunit 54 [Toxoplasma gondii GAB2-2007-GAL-DOM2]KFG48355.1 nucleoporin complex subunit 54 [Toxoplasma gondii p89]KFG64403.1 nucleoporin complex subunit 54 [Toxoplasma gondii RUB]KFH12213.1 nucleoporin complex subunit 54 [Toxoplasma gondii VAND]RQX72103.1 nucleoporin complex subunit 54 [Toxoplasma gondii CAST]
MSLFGVKPQTQPSSTGFLGSSSGTAGSLFSSASSAQAPASSASVGLFSSSSSLAAASALSSSPSSSLSSLPLHQQQYVEAISRRTQQTETLLSDQNRSMVNFLYQFDPAHAATHKNALLENQLQSFAVQNPVEGAALLAKWRKASSRSADPQNCLIVPVQGVQELSARVTMVAQATELLAETLGTVAKDTERLMARNQQMREKLDLIRQRHTSLGHEFIKVVNLIENVAVSRGVAEKNPRSEAANAQILASLEEEFPWEEWQRRIDLLRVWLPTLQRTSATATGFPAPSADERSKPVLDKEQEESLVDVLSAQTEAVEATTQSLANTEQDVERLESAVSRRRKGVR